ncbi:hypothetical protein ElyMa_006716600 [Elysia marginata]|uniref:Secreted protein n=1 Tax=Elysia marginata TaxID=1093978 RepID=A0AAV4IWT7_9GAST|nr:hypothetical protein ElyMa_006716600 [Elysia marginata]
MIPTKTVCTVRFLALTLDQTNGASNSKDRRPMQCWVLSTRLTMPGHQRSQLFPPILTNNKIDSVCTVNTGSNEQCIQRQTNDAVLLCCMLRTTSCYVVCCGVAPARASHFTTAWHKQRRGRPSESRSRSLV